MGENIRNPSFHYPVLTHAATRAYTKHPPASGDRLHMLNRRSFMEERLLGLARRCGVATDDLEAGPSLLAETAPTPQLLVLARIFREVRAALNDELIGMTGKPVPFRTFDFAMRAALHCRTLSEFVLELISAAELMYSPPDLGAFLQIDNDGAAIELRNAHNPHDDFYFAHAFMSTHRGMSWLIDERIMLLRIELCSREIDHLDDLRHIFQCEVQLGRRRNAIVFDAHYLNAPILRGLTEMNEYLARRPLDILYIPGVDRSLASAVLRLLREHLLEVHDVPCAGEVARRLDLSGNLLHRRLAREGTTLQALKDRARHEIAAQKLLHSTLPIEQISGLLGFEETNSFYRAFKKWAGVTPQVYRTQHSSLV